VDEGEHVRRKEEREEEGGWRKGADGKGVDGGRRWINGGDGRWGWTEEDEGSEGMGRSDG
jgi:hypothetical protein